jgi:hypothetical protein
VLGWLALARRARALAQQARRLEPAPRLEAERLLLVAAPRERPVQLVAAQARLAAQPVRAARVALQPVISPRSRRT